MREDGSLDSPESETETETAPEQPKNNGCLRDGHVKIDSGKREKGIARPAGW